MKKVTVGDYELTEKEYADFLDALYAIKYEDERVRDRIAAGRPNDMRRLYRGADGILWLDIVKRSEFSNGVPIWMIHKCDQQKQGQPDDQYTAKWVYPKQVCDWIEDDDNALWNHMPPSMVMRAHLDAEKAVFDERMAKLGMTADKLDTLDELGD